MTAVCSTVLFSLWHRQGNKLKTIYHPCSRGLAQSLTQTGAAKEEILWEVAFLGVEEATTTQRHCPGTRVNHMGKNLPSPKTDVGAPTTDHDRMLPRWRLRILTFLSRRQALPPSRFSRRCSKVQQDLGTGGEGPRMGSWMMGDLSIIQLWNHDDVSHGRICINMAMRIVEV